MGDIIVLILVLLFFLGPAIMPLWMVVDAVIQKAKPFFKSHPKVGRTIISTIALLLAVAIGAGAGGYFGYQRGEEDGNKSGYGDGYLVGYKTGIQDKIAYGTTKYNAGYEDGYAASKTVEKPNFLTENKSQSGSSSTQQTSVTVYVTNTGSKYHKSWCSYLHSSKIAVSLSWAKSNGYGACSRCY